MKKLIIFFCSVMTLLFIPSCNSKSECLSFEALEDNTNLYAFKTSNFKDSDLPNISFSFDGKVWTDVTIIDETNTQYKPFVILKKNQKIYLKGNNPNGFSKGENEFIHFNALDNDENEIKFSSSGNIMSLIDDGKCKTDTIPCDYCFTNMFGETDYSKSRLIKSPDLPATNLKPHCYDHMFFNNNDLITASELPSLKMEEKCYAYMFSQCVSLKVAPSLKSTITAPYCYDHMFYGNTSLEYIELHISDWDREGNFPCCFWVSFDGTYKMSENGTFKCKKELIPNIDDPDNFSETRVPYHWKIVTF